MASSSGNESENSTEEIVSAPTRRTRSGRATAPKPARRGKRRGGAPARSTRTTRKSARVQEEEEEEDDLEEMLDQGQGSELDEMKEFGLPGSTENPLQFESGTVEPGFSELAGDQFAIQEEAEEGENGLDGEQEAEAKTKVEAAEGQQSPNSDDESSREASKAESDAESGGDKPEVRADSDSGDKPEVRANSDSGDKPEVLANSDSGDKPEVPPDSDSEEDVAVKPQLVSEDVEMAEESSGDTPLEQKVDTVPETVSAEPEEEPMVVQEVEATEPEEQDGSPMEEPVTEEASKVDTEESSKADTEEADTKEASVKTEPKSEEAGEPKSKSEKAAEAKPKQEEAKPKQEEAMQVKEEVKGETVPEKKRKRRGFSDAPAEEFVSPPKKQVKDEPAVNGEKSEGKEEGGSSPDEGGDKSDKRRKTLPELEKYWKAVREDASDFTGWTYLLQYVDQESDVEAAREAYDAFLSLYPYCYGYWRKYADYEKKKGSPENCDKVFERGLRAIPLSVDLWLHFLNHCKANHPGDDAFIRSHFEKALAACGMEFRSDRLWESYIKWETENKNLQNVTAIYDRLLATPTQGYTSHFDNFELLAKAHLPQKLLSVDEFLEIRKEWVASKRPKEEKEKPAALVATEGAEETTEETTEEAKEAKEPEEPAASVEQKQKEEIAALREKLIESRKEVHKATVAAVADRWNFEEGIKRPYFHVKPLEKSQLRNWREYLDFEIEQGNRQRVIVLFERCLIACALYEEFWVRFLQYLEGQKDDDLAEKVRNVYQRACTIHHAKKANLHLHWAAFEEKEQNWEQAAGILEALEKQMPGLLQLAYRRINLERRRGDLARASALYESYVTSFKNQTISTNLAIKHARFCCKVKGDIEGAIAVLNKALDKDKANSRLYLQLIDMHMQRSPMDVVTVVAVFDRFLASEASPGNKATFAQRKLEFLEDFGNDITSVLKAQDEQQHHQKMAREAKKGEAQDKNSDSGSGGSTSKKSKHSTPAEWTPPMPSQPPPPHPSSQYSAQGATSATGYSGQTGGYTAPYGPQQQGYAQQQGAYNQAYPAQGTGNNTDPNNYYQNWGGYTGYNQGWGNYNYY